MIDKLILNIPFHKSFVYEHIINQDDSKYYVLTTDLPISFLSSDVQITNDNQFIVTELKTKFESLPSSYSGLACKVYPEAHNIFPSVAIHCSPAKLLQGHNLYGFDDLRKSAFNMIAVLGEKHPFLFEMLDVQETIVSEIDITYSVFIKQKELRYKFIEYVSNISHGQTKNRGDAYQTTCYFGSKTSRLKKLKCYLKYEEIKQSLTKKFKTEYENSYNINEQLLNTEYAQTAVRFETTIKKRYLQRAQVPIKLFELINYIDNKPDTYIQLFYKAWQDVFNTMSNDEIKIMNDKNIYKQIEKAHISYTTKGKISKAKVNRLYSFYIYMKSEGYYNAREFYKNSSSISTFNRNVKLLIEAGINKSTLQNLQSNATAEIFKIPHLITFDFDNQVPSDYQIPDNLYPDLYVA